MQFPEKNINIKLQHFLVDSTIKANPQGSSILFPTSFPAGPRSVLGDHLYWILCPITSLDAFLSDAITGLHAMQFAPNEMVVHLLE
jgi:hypothetical protein